MRKRPFILALAGCLFLFCADTAAGRHRHRAHADGRLPYGSPWMQERQNTAANRLDLSRMDDLETIQRFIDAGRLVRIQGGSGYVLETIGHEDPRNAEFYAYARPWVKHFLDRELGEGHDKYGVRYRVTSLVRTRPYQRLLCESNGNAICGRSWWKQSSHLTGSTVDITRKDLDQRASDWLEGRIAQLARQGKVIAIREGDCFHVMVLPSYDDEKRAIAKRQKHAKKERHPPPRRHKRHTHHKARH